MFWEYVIALQCEKNKEAKCNRSETAPGCDQNVIRAPPMLL